MSLLLFSSLPFNINFNSFISIFPVKWATINFINLEIWVSTRHSMKSWESLGKLRARRHRVIRIVSRRMHWILRFDRRRDMEENLLEVMKRIRFVVGELYEKSTRKCMYTFLIGKSFIILRLIFLFSFGFHLLYNSGSRTDWKHWTSPTIQFSDIHIYVNNANRLISKTFWWWFYQKTVSIEHWFVLFLQLWFSEMI